VRQHVQDLRALLRGEVVDVDGGAVQMIHGPGQAPPRPIDVPILLATEGPKGAAVAHEVADGVISFTTVQPGFEWSQFLCIGTVLDEGEDFGSPRVLKAAGPAAAVVYHFLYELGSPGFDGLPDAAAWKEQAEAAPKKTRHLETHRGHLTALNPWDERVVGAKSIEALTLTGPPDAVRARVEELVQQGATEIGFQPMGDDLERELRAFRAAVAPLN
jgi:5,10-methylenetetrahydromethanopterin reductase